jgi:deoxyadenosine/deoxycytidine kinase
VVLGAKGWGGPGLQYSTTPGEYPSTRLRTGEHGDEHERFWRPFTVTDRSAGGTKKVEHFVAIAGNIGVGKTRLTGEIARMLGWEPYFEPVEVNPYLDDFYGDMVRWSFHLQVYFLSKRFEMHKKLVEGGVPCVQDRTIYEDAEIFARILHRRGKMDDRDYDNYVALFSVMMSYLRPPDLIIGLRASIETLVARIGQRGRDCEKDIDRDYLAELNRTYDDWFARAGTITQFMLVDTDKIDLLDQVEMTHLVEEVAGRVGYQLRLPFGG